MRRRSSIDFGTYPDLTSVCTPCFPIRARIRPYPSLSAQALDNLELARTPIDALRVGIDSLGVEIDSSGMETHCLGMEIDSLGVQGQSRRVGVCCSAAATDSFSMARHW